MEKKIELLNMSRLERQTRIMIFVIDIVMTLVEKYVTHREYL